MISLITYDFTSRERELGRVCFALTLNRKRMTERVIIGKSEEIRQILNGGDGEVYYDEVRPLGGLLLSFGSDKSGEWNSRILPLRESYAKIFPLNTERWKMAQPISDFLAEKYQSGEPSVMFAAIRTWEDYLNCFNLNRGAELLSDRLFILYKPFMVYDDYKPWQKEAEKALSAALKSEESTAELWYPVAKRPFETVVTTSSFLPIIFYYLHKIEEWRLVFQECKVCGKFFVARSRHYELCSDECRKKKSVEAKREFDERAKGDRLEQLDEAAYYYWYNRLRKLRNGKAANPDRAAAFKVEFEVFRKEAVQLKSKVKRGELRINEFADWLILKQNDADKLMGEVVKKLIE